MATAIEYIVQKLSPILEKHGTVRTEVEKAEEERFVLQNDVHRLYDRQDSLHEEREQLKAELAKVGYKIGTETSSLQSIICNVEIGQFDSVSEMDRQITLCKKNLEKATETSAKLEKVRQELDVLSQEENDMLTKLAMLRDKSDTMRQKFDANDVLVNNAVTTIHEAIGSLKRKMVEMYDNNCPTPVPSSVPSNDLPSNDLPSNAYINVYSSPVRNCGGRSPEHSNKRFCPLHRT